LYYYGSPPPSHDVASSLRLGILDEFFDSNADILDIGCVEVQIVHGRGSKGLGLLLHKREQGARNSAGCVRIASRWGNRNHYVMA
jgi:hypothetical protein